MFKLEKYLFIIIFQMKYTKKGRHMGLFGYGTFTYYYINYMIIY